MGARAQPGIPLAEDGLNPAPLPQFIGTEWIGQETEVTAIEREMLPADTGYARRIYVSLDDRREQVLVSVVLSGQDRTSIHRPELCLVGQGWSIRDRQETRFGEEVPAALLRLEREWVGEDGRRAQVPALFVYWFVGRESMATTTVARLWRTALNRLRLQPDRWAYVVVQAVVLPGETEEVTRARMERVARPLLAQLSPAGVLSVEKD
jgi:EpsI family protein